MRRFDAVRMVVAAAVVAVAVGCGPKRAETDTQGAGESGPDGGTLAQPQMSTAAGAQQHPEGCTCPMHGEMHAKMHGDGGTCACPMHGDMHAKMHGDGGTCACPMHGDMHAKMHGDGGTCACPSGCPCGQDGAACACPQEGEHDAHHGMSGSAGGTTDAGMATATKTTTGGTTTTSRADAGTSATSGTTTSRADAGTRTGATASARDAGTTTGAPATSRADAGTPTGTRTGTSTGASTSTTGTATGTIASVAAPDKKTERLWKAKCASCHGMDGKGQTEQGKKMKLSDMSSPAWQAKRSDAQLRKVIVDGYKGVKDGVVQEMEGYGDLAPDQIDALVKYTRWVGQKR